MEAEAVMWYNENREGKAMAKIKTVTERHLDEILSDNTHQDFCRQCKNCAMWGNGNDPFSNRYDKGNCDMFPNPDHKPGYVINNRAPCEFRVERG